MLRLSTVKELAYILTTDMSKAFDSLRHSLVVKKLEAYGFGHNSLNLLRSYFDNRLNRVKIGDVTSDWKKMVLGCLQASFQHCWGHTSAEHMVYKVFWVVSFPLCPAGPNIAGSCCIRLHTTVNTDATTPNIPGPTMSGVVASVST